MTGDPETPAALETALLAAHEEGDEAALAGLYARAADAAAAAGRGDAEGFYLTHAYVYALASGHVRADAFHARLVGLGRDE
jgi:hypothetical protein